MKSLLFLGGLIITCLLTTPTTCFGKEGSDKLPPTWIKNPPQPCNETYYFKVVETDAGG